MSRLTIFPTLTWRLFLSALLGGSKKENQTINEIWSGKKEQTYWFSRSAWSLKAIAQWWEKAFEQESPNFWVPDYFCNQSLELLRQAGVKLTFYPITENLIPDWKQCQKMAAESSPDIFLLVHYFGQPTEGAGAKKFCNKFKAVLVEDAAHALMPTEKIGSIGDFVCYSPHKLLAIPDGAVLVQRSLSKGVKKLVKGNPVETMEEVYQSWTQNVPSPWKWVCKRLIQRTLPYWFLRRNFRKGGHDFLNDAPSTAIADSPFQSKMSRALLQRQQKEFSNYALRRQENLSVLNSVIDNDGNRSPLLKDQSVIPYLGVMQAVNKENANETFLKIAKAGEPVQSWPDLPPEVLENVESHEKAVHLRNTLLTVPVHQGFNFKQADRLRHLYRQSIGEVVKEPPIKLKTFTDDGNEWNQLLTKAGKSNLLQSWAYGEAKQSVEAWNVRRITITLREKIIALVQVLEKRVGPIRVVRINRGPVFLENEEFSTVRAVYNSLRKEFSLWTGKVLLIAPELDDLPSNHVILKLLSYRARKSEKWSSAWLNLKQSEELLRKNLISKWRNMLNVVERDEQLTVSFGSSEQDFQWIMNCYADMQQAKDFQGPAIPLLEALRKQLDRKEDFLICRANNLEGETVAAIVLIRHGAAATYLIGWNGDEGRKLKANNFLLWNGILEMQRQGTQWFDLGGIDEVNTPDIARFKQGMNGETYQLIGEWCNLL